MLKISAFYLDKQKSFITKKIWRVPCTMHSSFFSQQMQYCLATLLVYMALALPYQAWPSSPYKPLSCQTLRQPQFLSKFQSLLYANFKFRKLIWFICLRIWTTHQYFLNKSYLHHGATLTDYENVMYAHFNYKNHSRFLQGCLIVLPEFNF